MRLIFSSSLIFVAAGWAQTQVDLRTQSRNVDFSKAATTKPAKTGTVLPAACSAGEIFFNLSAPSGAALYNCQATNVWSVAGGGAGSGSSGSIPTVTVGSLPGTCNIGDVRFATDAAVNGGGYYLYFCKAANTWTQFGYEAGASGALAANCSSVPCTIDTTNAVPLKVSANTWLGANDFSGASQTEPFRLVTADPATCVSTSREFIFNIATNMLKTCAAQNTWVAVGAIAGPVLSAGQGYFAPYGFPGENNTAIVWNSDNTGAFACTQFAAPYAMTLNKAGVILGTGPGAGKGLIIGYMDANMNTLAQGTLVAPGGSGNAVVTFRSSLVLQPGIYYQCIGSEDANTTLVPAMSGAIAAGFSNTLNYGSEKRVVVCSNSPSGTGAGYALPASCGTATAKQYPVISTVLLP